MAISTYAELQTAVANWLGRDNLTSRIVEFITLGEANINRLLRVKDMEATATVTPSTSVRYVSLPTGYMEQIAFTDDLGDKLIETTPEVLEQLAYGAGTSRPRYYRVSSRIDFDCVADTTYSFTMRYWKRLNIASDSTNSILTNHPGIYLYASLYAAAPFIKDDKRIATFGQILDDEIKAASWQSSRNKKLLVNDIGVPSSPNIIRGV
jgi:hypothetical protein